MEKITFTNTQGTAVTLAYSGDYLLESYNGFNEAALEPTNIKGYKQNGYTNIGITYGIRTLDIVFYIAANDVADYYRKRDYLNTVFNPLLGQGVLTYENDNITRCIKCYCSLLPDEIQSYGNLRKLDIQLTATNPFWYDPTENGLKLTGYSGGLKFDFRFNSTIKFGTAASSGIITNTGGIAAPITVKIQGSDTQNPKLILRNTGEYIGLNTSFDSDDVATITTDYGNKRITINNQSAMRYLMGGSTFFSLPTGDNNLTLECTSGNPEIYIYWYNWYVGV